MKRRGNKSNKVPNVKLRPAQDGALSQLKRTATSTCWAQDSQLGSDDTSIVDLCPRPFKGVVLCATGVVDKPTLFKQALELGATSMNAFTDRVTHLVAVDHGGAKYMCALERKIPILTPSWITDSYQIWLRGDDVNLEESVNSHRLPIFSGVVLCPSGFADITVRTEINKVLTKHGGVYLKNLERPVKVTHLLCSGDEETDKMRYAEKFNSRGEANVHLVWEEWFWDSLEFGGRFDEEKYQVRRPRPQAKIITTQAEFTTTSSQPSEPQGTLPSNHQDTPPPDQADPEEELATVRRLPAATLQLWSSLLGRRGYEIMDGELLRSPSKVRTMPPPPPSPQKQTGNGSIISQFRRSNSFAPARPDLLPSTRPQPFRRTRTVSVMNPKDGADGSFMGPAVPLQEKNGESSTSAVAPTSNIFAGAKFIALGEAKSPSVRNAIMENGGKMVLGVDDDEVDYIIVRLVSGSKLYREESDEFQRAKYRTECWLERCIFEDRICLPEDHITFLPLSIQTPVPGAERVTLSFSGLDQSEACWIKRLLRALGINLAQFFSRRSTHLLCPSRSGAKFDKACEWGVPVVAMDWLSAIATSGQIPSVVQLPVPDLNQPQKLPPVGEGVNADPKGKGKAIEAGNRGIPEDDSMDGALPTDVKDNPPQSPKQYSRPSSQDVSSHPDSLSPHRIPPQSISFGRPTGALAVPSELQRQPTLITTPTRPKLTSTPADLPPSQKAPSTPIRTRSTPVIRITPKHTSYRTLSAPSAMPPSDPTRRPSRIEIERERKQARIPSSKSPSPMKIPRQQSKHVLPECPSSPTREVAKALQDGIVSLLGKRQPPEDEATVNARAGKRPRPQRPKMQSRQPSDAQISEVSPAPVLVYEDSISPFESFDEPSLLESSIVDHGMRVTYEDPGQREEKKRLMSLLKIGGSPSDGVSGNEGAGKGPGKGTSRTRRSARIAGF